MRVLWVLLSFGCSATEATAPEREPEPACLDALLTPRLWRLSDRQHANAIRDLLGVEIAGVRTPGQSDDPFVEASELLGVSGTLAHQYQQAAEAAALRVRCDDEACARDLIDRLAPRAFRRPLEDEESQALFALYQEHGASAVVEAVLQHPAFLYRSELSGELTPHELAAALSFTFLESIPDEPLWEKAQDGSLGDREIFAAEVDRLLSEPRVQDNLTRAMIDWLGARRVLAIHRNPDFYPEFDEAMARALLSDVERFVSHVLLNGGGVKELLTSRAVISDEITLPIYGVDQVGFAELGPDRPGVLTRAGMIAAYAQTDAVSVVHQGLFIRRALQCGEELSSPPSDLVRSVDAETNGLSLVQLAEFRIEHPVCGGCHRQIDPLGVPFLGFDSIGRVIEGEGEPDAAARLSLELARDDQVARCAARHLTARMLGHRASCLASGEIDRFVAEGASFLDLFSGVAKSETFSRREVVR